MANKPIRLQLSRRKGFDLQTQSRAINGLAAINVARPFRWGNPWKIGDRMYVPDLNEFTECLTVEDCVAAFTRSVDWDPDAPMVHNTVDGGQLVCWGGYGATHKNRKTARAELAGKNLACWCKLDSPCHADALLKIANPSCEEVEPRP